MAQAEFRSTAVSIFETRHKDHGWIQVLGYSNTAQNLATGPNAMLLHLPAAMPMSPDNFIVHNCPSMHKDMIRASQTLSRSTSFGSVDIPKSPVFVFDYDIYTVVLASSPQAIPDALSSVVKERRPTLNRSLYNFYNDNLKNWWYALCCFDNREAREAKPMLLWYTPQDRDFLSLPALDCHTGGVPDLVNPVDVDHWIFLGHDDFVFNEIGNKVSYTDSGAGAISSYLPPRVVGKRFLGKEKNGDFAFNRRRLLMTGNANMMRLQPGDYR